MLRRGTGAVLALRRRLSTVAAASAPAGRLLICGTGESNKLGVGDLNDREVPEAVGALADVPIVHVACGKYHTAAISADGEVFAWGLESSGQLGLGPKRPKAPTPTRVDALSGIGAVALSCGSYHTLALTAEGEVYSCGFGGSFWNGAGGLGHGDRTQRETPEKLGAFGEASGVRAVSISAGGYHSVALDSEGAMWSWGRGEWGRLGFGDSADQLAPARLDEWLDLGVKSLVAGESHSACIDRDGRIFTWGRNEHWQLGYEVAGLLNSGQSFDAQAEPAEVPMESIPTPIVARHLACGETGTVIALEDGRVLTWGMRRYFEPTLVPGLDALDAPIASVHCGATPRPRRAPAGQPALARPPPRPRARQARSTSSSSPRAAGSTRTARAPRSRCRRRSASRGNWSTCRSTRSTNARCSRSPPDPIPPPSSSRRERDAADGACMRAGRRAQLQPKSQLVRGCPRAQHRRCYRSQRPPIPRPPELISSSMARGWCARLCYGSQRAQTVRRLRVL